MSFDDDVRIVKRVRRGDRESFALLVEKYERPIFSFIYHFFNDYALAEDLTQEVFLRSYRFIRTYDTKQKFSTWLFTIARNLCIDEMRKREKERTLPIDEVRGGNIENPSSRNPEDIAEALSDSAFLKRLIAKLPERYRTALLLFYFHEMSYEEISSVMGISMANTKIILFRAKKMLSDLYRKGE
ncbi:MAG: sigma-70 family RNA polymerase sigma factor [Deltaproteobacteria bacterium]|nr:MAG: sigma-70 family RNA polymerase sigma factor [Deltaproteobacteria bacterium]